MLTNSKGYHGISLSGNIKPIEKVEKKKSLKELAYENLSSTVNLGITHISADATNYSGRTVSINGKECLAFGFCAYLGLENHPKLRQAMMDTVRDYGIHFPSSRAYISSGLFQKLNLNLCKIFNKKHISIFSSITIGHLATLPHIIDKNDAAIFDQQAHFSMQSINKLLKTDETSVIAHNNIEKLEEKLELLNLSGNVDKIWYIADGIYSMYGDSTNYEGLKMLQAKYKNFYLYIDDAHGLSWTGKNGCGDAASNLELNERTVLAVSLAKGFGSGGGAIVFPNEEMKNSMIFSGGNYTFSGPMYPPTIGAAIASAEIHLSPEIYKLQDQLGEKISWTNELALKLKLPMVSSKKTPIYFLACGIKEVAFSVCTQLIENGFHTNPCAFPAVPVGRAGVRFTINNHSPYEDINLFLTKMAELYHQALKNYNHSISKVDRSFRRTKSYSSV